MEGVMCIGEDVKEVSEATDVDEGVELEEDPSQGEDRRAWDEVEELEMDGEVCEEDKEAVRFLALDDVVDGLEGFSFFACVDTMMKREGRRLHVWWNAIERKGGRGEEKERVNESKHVEERMGENEKLGIWFV